MLRVSTARKIPRHITDLIPNLGRENPNERLAALAAIDRRLKGEDLDWHDVQRACQSSALAFPPPSRSTTEAPCPASMQFGDLARACRDLDGGQLTSREREFVASMCRIGFTSRASYFNDFWLSEIYSRLQQRAAA